MRMHAYSTRAVQSTDRYESGKRPLSDDSSRPVANGFPHFQHGFKLAVNIHRIGVSWCRLRRSAPWMGSFVVALLAVEPGCHRSLECTTEVTADAGAFRSVAKGEGEEGPVMKAALRDACQKMCVGTKAPMIDACVSKCVVDVGAEKIVARTSCKK